MHLNLTFDVFDLCFYFLSQTLKSIPLGIDYGIWAGVGIENQLKNKNRSTFLRKASGLFG
ncbi:SMR family transporter [Pedobacter antarcticus]|uniref:SMR family transporter n=1 Tax=Pedobacter antarcticus TaxID=34086 RepID=UPI00191C3D81